MKITKCIFTCLHTNLQYYLMLSTALVIAQSQIAYSHLSIEDGLSQNSVISIAQDSIGYMWFATQDGLNKYDGYTFKTYYKQFEDITRPTYSKLGKVYNDKQNNLWIITNSGKLEIYNPELDSFIPIKQFNSVSTVFQDNDHNTYIGTYGKGLFKIKSKTKDTIQLLKPEDKHRSINDIYSFKNKIIVAATGTVLSFSNNNDYKSITKKDDSINYSTIEKTKDEILWFGTYGHGLYYIKNNESFITPYINKDLSDNLNIEDLLVDDLNRLWIATYGNGAFLHDFTQNKTTNFLENTSDPYAIHYNDILSLFQDNTGTIWLGSDGAGANYYDEHLIKFNVLSINQMPKSVNIDVVRSISTDHEENMWIGTSGKGLTYIDTKNNVYKTFSNENTDLASNRIISLSHLEKELWIGHQGYGLNIIEESGNYKYFPDISKYIIWKIVPESQNRSWLCTENHGLVLFDKNKGIIEQYNADNSNINSNNIKTITPGNDGLLWIGTKNNGIYKLNRKNNTVSKLKTINDPIKCLFYKDDILWVGTFGKGLKRYNTKTRKLKTYTTEDGLPNNVIYGILPDDDNNLWLSSNIGLTKFKIVGEKKILLIENYSNYDGLQALEFNTGAYYKSPNGTLYFGGLKGVNWFHPSQLTINTVEPKTIISNLDLFNNPIDIINNRKFKHHQNTITFTFSSLHFSQPKRNYYKYRLINNDKEWINAGNTHTAHYTNLPPNTYEFQVISSNYDGVWNNIPATYNFTIKQPWYANTVSKILYIILLFIISYLVYKYLKWRLQMKLQLQLEHTETERLKNLDEFKSKLFTNISHEFRTPLTLILGPVERQLSDKNITAEKKEDLGLISQNAKRLLNLVDQLIDLTKLETGHIKLKVENADLSTLIHQLISAFKYQIEEKKIDFKTKIDTISEVWFDRDIIEKIIVNLLANAVKYTPKKGFINFSVHLQDEHAVITIINNGSTIKSDQINNLFTRFYQVNPNADGVGIGLALVKELVTLANGSLIANTINKDELQFTVTIPINKEAFIEDDIVEITKTSDSQEQQDSSSATNKILNYENVSTSDKPIVLIVEDNQQLRHYIKSILDEQYNVIVSVNGKKGLKKALSKIPDLIVSDIMMPEMNGIDLCNTLKNNTLTSHIPIILLTAKTGESNELEGLEVGADDFISKPFSSKILVKRIENLISFSKSLQKRYSQHTSLKPKDIAINNLDESFLSQVEDILRKHLSEPNFNAQTFSDLMTMSRMQLHRKLIALTGLSTSQFIRSQRLKLSTKLLQESDLTVSEVAYQVGFNTTSYFIKCFKEAYNCTPNSYIPKD